MTSELTKYDLLLVNWIEATSKRKLNNFIHMDIEYPPGESMEEFTFYPLDELKIGYTLKSHAQNRHELQITLWETPKYNEIISADLTWFNHPKTGKNEKLTLLQYLDETSTG